MSIVAILVDGGFYQRRAQYYWGAKSPVERANELMDYCKAHVHTHDKLYRIFYYDCPPSNKKVFHPFTQKQIDLSKSPLYGWMMDFHEQMRNSRKVALRLGELSENNLCYTINPDVTKKLCRGAISLADLNEKNFTLNIEQKGVDMRVGVDIASMAFKHQVNKIVLISGDSDFVPAAKLARREGIDFILDPMGATIRPSLNEHIDGLISPRQYYKDAIKKDSEPID